MNLCFNLKVGNAVSAEDTDNDSKKHTADVDSVKMISQENVRLYHVSKPAMSQEIRKTRSLLITARIMLRTFTGKNAASIQAKLMCQCVKVGGCETFAFKILRN